jgi:glycosyltransferase involved in cell wall biosynthesis
LSLPPATARILVGITTHNRAAVLPRAVASALDQSGVQLRVAVHDDGSTDATTTLARGYGEVEWTRSDQPLGLRAVRQRWMQRTDADFFVSLDDDAWFRHGDEIAVALHHLEADPALAAVAFDILSPDAPEPQPRREPNLKSMFVGCGHMLRLSAAQAVGGYAEMPGPYGAEEKDLCLRLADAGHRIAFLPGVHVWHEKAWGNRDQAALHRSGVCNELVMTTRRCPLPDVLLVLPLKVVSFALFWLRQPKYRRAGWDGLRDFLRLRRVVWRSRQPVRRTTFWRFHWSR